MVVGIIIFSLLTIINFVVVTKGAGRVAEVAARFTLEALPGKQMAIDGDLSAGLISQKEAKEQRLKVTQEAEFYGSMDGASKFVRGDAIAGIIITVVNIIGGFCIGLMVKGMAWQECIQIFTRLTVGDGLVSQIPALLVSIGAGIMVTRASNESVSSALSSQVFNHPKVTLITGITLLVMSMIPGMPTLIMVPISAGLLFYAYVLFKRKLKKQTVTKESVYHPVEVRLGSRLVHEAEELKDHLVEIREKMLRELGVTLPSVTIKDHLALSPSQFELRIKGVCVAKERVESENLAFEIEKGLMRNADLFVTRQEIARWMEQAKRKEHVIVPKLNYGQMLTIAQSLVQEQVSIADFMTILEILSDHDGEKDLGKLTQHVREAMKGEISEHFFGQERKAYVITLDPKVEQMIQVASHQTDSKGRLRPQTVEKIAHELNELSEKVLQQGGSAIVLTESGSRGRLRHLIKKQLPDLPVLSYDEVARDVKVETIGMVSKEILI